MHEQFNPPRKFHVLSEVDSASRRATCKKCGSVDIRPSKQGKLVDGILWRCWNAVREEYKRKPIIEYRRSYARRRKYDSGPNSRAAKRRALLAELKLERGCHDCGYRQHHVALDFDHRPGEMKSFSIALNLRLRWQTILAEVEKCDVVCSNCHRIRTFTRRVKPVSSQHLL
jgi:hypothetical protein